jgi:hypothetical protein
LLFYRCLLLYFVRSIVWAIKNKHDELNIRSEFASAFRACTNDNQSHLQ